VIKDLSGLPTELFDEELCSRREIAPTIPAEGHGPSDGRVAKRDNGNAIGWDRQWHWQESDSQSSFDQPLHDGEIVTFVCNID
jgi:hypothetical protein